MSNKDTEPLTHKKIHIEILISDDAEVLELNKKFRGKSFTTDVLSFNLNEQLDDGTYYLGDIVVNKQQAARQAKDFNNSTEEEISELIAHGVLHLLGKHHDGDDH